MWWMTFFIWIASALGGAYLLSDELEAREKKVYLYTFCVIAFVLSSAIQVLMATDISIHMGTR